MSLHEHETDQFQNVILQGLRLLAANPDMDLWDERVPDILQLCMRPHELVEVIGKLRTLKPQENRASSSDQPAAQAAADPVVMVTSSVSEPAAATCEGIVKHMASENFMDVVSASKCVSAEAIWAKIRLEKKPLLPDFVEDPQYCTKQVHAYNPWNDPALKANGEPCSHYEAATPR